MKRKKIDKESAEIRIEVLKSVLEELADINDSLIDYVKEFPYDLVMGYISKARCELKSEVMSLQEFILETN